MLIRATGIVECFEDRAVAWIDRGIQLYYFSLIPKYYCASQQAYAAHITIVRTGKEYMPKIDVSGRVVEFWYENVVRYNEPYFYLEAFSDDIGWLRQSLGQTFYRTGFDRYHITVGNTKKSVSEPLP